jgi:hypothetical protein
MKTKITIIVALWAITLYSMAQTIPNSGFETWENIGGWYFNPENWETNNSQIMTPVLQETNSYSGNYSLTINHNFSARTGYAKSRFPFNVNAVAIKAYVKCEISTRDKVSVLVNAYLNQQLTGDGMWTSSNSISEWTLITIPITQKSSEADSLEIQIFGGDSLQTSISVDEISYDLISGINTHTSPVYTLYPNPFSEKLRYEISGPEENQMILFEITDVYGRTIARVDKYTNQGELNFPDIPAGIYIVKITTNLEVRTIVVIKESV